jgi:hypothetical protein
VGIDAVSHTHAFGEHESKITDQEDRQPIQRGEVWGKGKLHWSASITHNGECRHPGVFDAELEAAQARDDAVLELLGECAALKIPLETGRN